MIKYANMQDLKERTPKVLTNVDKGDVVVITYRGKPRALISAFSEDALEDYIFAHSRKFKKFLKGVQENVALGDHSDFRKFIQEEGIKASV